MYMKRGRSVWWPALLHKRGGSDVTSAVGGTVHKWDNITVGHSVCKSASVGGLGILWGDSLPQLNKDIK